MASVGSSILPSPQSSDDTTATIFNVATTASTEASQALPSNCKGFILRTRDRGNLQISYVSGNTNTLFFTVRSNAVYTDDNFYSSQTIYFQTDKNDTVEIIAFT